MNTSHHYHYIPESMTRLARLVVLLLLGLLALQVVSLLTPQPVRVVRESPAVIATGRLNWERTGRVKASAASVRRSQVRPTRVK